MKIFKLFPIQYQTFLFLPMCDRHPLHSEIEDPESQPQAVLLHRTPNLLHPEAPHIYFSSSGMHHFPLAVKQFNCVHSLLKYLTRFKSQSLYTKQRMTNLPYKSNLHLSTQQHNEIVYYH